MSFLSILTREPPKPFHTRTLALALFAVSLTFAAAFFLWHWPSFEDDVFISLRYARNLLEGHGLSWNPGERVEGYTNFLYIMLVALLGWLGMDLAHAAAAISTAGYLGVIALLYYAMRTLRFYPQDEKDRADRLVWIIPLTLSLASFDLLYWAGGGLETTLFALLNAAAAIAVLRALESPDVYRHMARAGLLFALTTLTRPEGLLSFGVTGLFLFGYFLRHAPLREAVRRCAVLALPFLLIVIPYLLWKYYYFGGIIPNTWYAKSYGIDPAIKLELGTFYLAVCILSPPFLLLFGLYFLFVTKRTGPIRWHLLYLWLLVLAFCLHILLSGGDYMGGNRFFVPLLPLLALILFYGLGNFAVRRQWMRIKNMAVLALPPIVLQYAIFDSYIFSPPVMASYTVADYVSTQWPKNSLIVISPAGALPYLAPNHRYIDALGLNDPHIARRVITEYPAAKQKIPGHFKGDGAYVLARKPDYIIFDLAWGMDWTGHTPFYLTDYEIWHHPDFRRDYRKHEIWVPLPQPFNNAGFIEKLQRLIRVYYSEDTPEIYKDGKVRFIYYERVAE